MARTQVLVVEDDEAIRRGIRDALTFAGYAVSVARDGQEGLEEALRGSPDIVLLDVLLPRRDGFEVLRELRCSRPRMPVIMLTARGTTEDRVRGLKLGADDYVVKPFDPQELLARVEAVLRRSAERPTDLSSLDLGHASVDFEKKRIDFGEGDLRPLSDLEASLLRYLAVNEGRVIERTELLQHVWGANPHAMETRTVDMHVSRLREKVERDPARPELIRTVRSKGYRLVRGQEGTG